MNKWAVTFTLLALVVAVLASASLDIACARANPSYSVERVNHSVGVQYNGFVIVNDTITLSGQTDSFWLGLPHAFGPNVVDAIACSTGDSPSVFPVALNVPLEGRVGFYGMSVDFSTGTPQVFSVVLVLSYNGLLSQDPTNASMFTLVFPAFPGLSETVPVCNSSILVPGAQYVNGTVSSLSFDAENLSPFTYNVSQVDVYVPGQDVQIFEIKQLNREIDINEFGETSVSDTYFITNNSTQTMNSIRVVVPPNASNLDVRDQLGRELAAPVLIGTDPTRYLINFTLAVESDRGAKLIVSYVLPSNLYVVKKQANTFAVNITFFQDTDSYVEHATVSFVLPEGARLSGEPRFQTILTGNFYDVSRNVFQETMSVSEENIISLDSLTVSLSYDYNPLWLAFRPTMWVWALTVVGAVIVAAWERPRVQMRVTVPSAGLRLEPDEVRAFVDAYDEKMKIDSEIDALEARVQKGKIPRPRYKIQKKTLETRVSTLERTLAESGGRIHSAGGHYSDLMRQLEVAETELDEVEANMKSIEARQNRGEISLETYRKLLGDYERRKDRAKTTISGILLRLREEIR